MLALCQRYKSGASAKIVNYKYNIKPENKGVDKDIVRYQTDLSGTSLLLPDMLGTNHMFLQE
jgi:hypothetical protein